MGLSILCNYSVGCGSERPLPAVDPSGAAMGNRFQLNHNGVGGVTKIKLRQHHTVE